MKETPFLGWVIGTAEATGWLVKHVPAPMVAAGNKWRPYAKAAGLPDLFLLHDDPPRLIIAELKGDGGKLSDAQQEFLTLAKAAADRDAAGEEPPGRTRVVAVYAWWPKDMPIIEQILKSKSLI